MTDQVTPPADPAEPKSDSTPKASEPEKYPDDHPLVTALAAQKQKNADLQKQIDEMKPAPKKDAPDPAPKAEDGDLANQLAELQKQVAEEKHARELAETVALRTRLAAGKIPAPLITKLTGTTEEEIKAEIAEIAPLIKSGPAPNPQQGQPSQGRGGSIAAGRDRYQQSHATP